MKITHLRSGLSLRSALPLIALGGLVVGCANGSSASTHQGSSSAGNNAPAVAATPAAASHLGDVQAPTIYARPALDVPRQMVTMTMPVNPNDVIDLDEGKTSPVTTTDGMRFVGAGHPAPAAQSFPVDSTDGESYLFLGPQVTDSAQIDAVLAGITVLDPTGKKVNVRADKGMATPAGGLRPMSMVSLHGLPTGNYSIKLDATAQKAGVALDFRQPASKIALTMQPSTYEHLFGNVDGVEVNLAEGGVPINGATVTATLIDESLKVVRPLTFVDRGQGRFTLAVDGAVLSDLDKVGAYLIDIQATGTAPSGASFHRSGRTGFHFGVPTAKISGVGAAKTVTAADGLIDAVTVDVAFESKSLDRLELSAMLTSVDAAGKEHPVAVAFAGDAFDPGVHTVTLRFDAGLIRATHLAGSYRLRNLKIFSIGTNTLFQRQAETSVAPLPSVSIGQLRPLANITPGVQQLIDEGVLYRE
jgi:hypothetical protein